MIVTPNDKVIDSFKRKKGLSYLSLKTLLNICTGVRYFNPDRRWVLYLLDPIFPLKRTHSNLSMQITCKIRFFAIMLGTSLRPCIFKEMKSKMSPKGFNPKDQDISIWHLFIGYQIVEKNQGVSDGFPLRDRPERGAY